MADLRLVFAAATGQFDNFVEHARNTIATAATAAMRQAGEIIKKEARANIASAGFGPRWQNTFKVQVYPDKNGKVSMHPVLNAWHKIPYAGIFERGGTISGSPFLWLPLPNVPNSINGKHMSPANYIRFVGPLQFIPRHGKPPLLGGYVATGSKGGGLTKITVPALKRGASMMKSHRTGAPAPRARLVPLFFAIDKVQMNKRFDILPIVARVNTMLPQLFLQNFKP